MQSHEHGRRLLEDALERVKRECGYPYVFLTTNGRTATPERVRACIEAGLDSLKFSFNFDGATPPGFGEIHDATIATSSATSPAMRETPVSGSTIAPSPCASASSYHSTTLRACSICSSRTGLAASTTCSSRSACRTAIRPSAMFWPAVCRFTIDSLSCPDDPIVIWPSAAGAPAVKASVRDQPPAMLSQAERDALVARANDVIEHIHRVISQVRRMEQGAEAAVQIHFSAQSHRTNAVMRTLTAITAIFLPLNLITGIFGMNFDVMPLQHQALGFWIALGAMAVLAAGVGLVFWRKRYLARSGR